ncbi:tetratricopeptide repeat protein 19, mitochondrial isoform X2 [Latimeria chalumnae]|uniref:tetratricopeptide repeat protein 19, mitochondrial isoform X2 n=1 Tax=Latimeria chalumnae TaxID=7897 RepID=UPI0003C1372A|nr:PREDICTED: tetratricopeptide repeat protein 19, mitochondrial isoform X2 [Latimeria chalumnae]|eukprot:XP_006007802.1 PREDICTED: tetratricopeptide repeat protein 19, mitochondrial isoform X2 [Latimeria chalumnae]
MFGKRSLTLAVVAVRNRSRQARQVFYKESRIQGFTSCTSGATNRERNADNRKKRALSPCIVWERGSGSGSGSDRMVSRLLGVAAFSFFTKSGEEEEESTEDRIILLLKKAKLNIMKEKLEEAEQYLHQAIQLAHQSQNNPAIIYTYTLMANLAFLRGQLHQAEKLFKAAMSFLLSSGSEKDDNAIIEMSLKLASIYGVQKQHQLAIQGFEFCIETLEEKIQKQKALSEELLSVTEKDNTRLLLGMCLDSYGRYLLANQQLELAKSTFEKALRISQEVQGDNHPQTVVLMNDLATAIDLQGHHNDAYGYVKKAYELAKKTAHPDQHIMLNNMAGILMHQGLPSVGPLHL